MLLFLFSCVDSGSGQICRILALSLLLIRICFVRILNGGIGLSACHIYSSALRAYAGTKCYACRYHLTIFFCCFGISIGNMFCLMGCHTDSRRLRRDVGS